MRNRQSAEEKVHATLAHTPLSQSRTQSQTSNAQQKEQKKSPFRITQGALAELRFVVIPGDGHCLFRSVCEHVDLDVSELRQLTAARMEHGHDKGELRKFFAGTDTEYQTRIDAIRNTNEWGDALEIEVIQRLLNRPIIVIRSDINPIIPDNLTSYSGEPIFVYYNGRTHYDAFKIDLKLKSSANDILHAIQESIHNGEMVTYNPTKPVVSKPAMDLQRAVTHSSYRYHLFISHRGTDKATTAFPLATLFAVFCGINTAFFDQTHISVGQTNKAVLQKIINDSRMVLAIIGKDFFESKWTVWEVNKFLERPDSGNALKAIPLFIGMSPEDCSHLSKECIQDKSKKHLSIEEQEKRQKIAKQLAKLSGYSRGQVTGGKTVKEFVVQLMTLFLSQGLPTKDEDCKIPIRSAEFDHLLETLPMHIEEVYDQAITYFKANHEKVLPGDFQSFVVQIKRRLLNLASPFPKAKALLVRQQALAILLRLVATGEQTQAEMMVNANPRLLLGKGTVTDLSQRTISEITPFQYALWALDWHMWVMLAKYLPKKSQHQQLVELDSKQEENARFFSLQPLIDALGNYIRSYKQCSRAQRQHLWCNVVGAEQKLLPVHVVNEYCRSDRSFYPAPSFDEQKLPRERKTDEGDWFDAGLGNSHAVERGWADKARCSKAIGYTSAVADLFINIVYGGSIFEADKPAISKLFEVRQKQREDLKDSLNRLFPGP